MEAGKLKTFRAGLQGEDLESCQLLILHFLGVRNPLQQLPFCLMIFRLQDGGLLKYGKENPLLPRLPTKW